MKIVLIGIVVFVVIIFFVFGVFNSQEMKEFMDKPARDITIWQLVALIIFAGILFT